MWHLFHKLNDNQKVLGIKHLLDINVLLRVVMNDWSEEINLGLKTAMFVTICDIR